MQLSTGEFTALQRAAWLKGREEGLKEAWDAIRDQRPGLPLNGNGSDPLAERNGMTIAMNIINQIRREGA